MQDATQPVPCRQKMPVSILYPSLHDRVLDALDGQVPPKQFHNRNTDAGTTKEYASTIQGRFWCRNGACRTDGWYSKKVAIQSRRYHDDTYTAAVYKQRCRHCNALGDLEVDEDAYVKRVSDRLKRWAGMEIEVPDRKGKMGKPHEHTLCEGCKAGVCREAEGY